MDEESITSNVQDLKGEDIDNGIRNLDEQPEAILEHILSFLSMKDAVRTSTLSKKWKLLWTSIPNLEFAERYYSDRELLMNSVDIILLLHDRSPIKEFHRDCEILWDASRVNEWVTAVVRRSVEICKVKHTEVIESYMLPCCLFTCDTLVELHVDMPCTLRLAPEVHLPNLKLLYLVDVIFLDECSTERLFSSPAIDVLDISYCIWVNLRAISISSPKLKHLGIHGISVDEGYSLDMGSDYHCQTMIRDCNLDSFNLSGPYVQ